MTENESQINPSTLQTTNPDSLAIFDKCYQDLRQSGCIEYGLKTYRPHTDGLLSFNWEPQWVKYCEEPPPNNPVWQDAHVSLLACREHWAGKATAAVISLFRNLIKLGLVHPALNQKFCAPMQARIDDMWLLLHYNFTSRNWTGDLAIKGLISDTIQGELKDERKSRALFKNIKTLVNGSDLLQAMLSRNDDLALETPIKWRRIKCDDPERIQLHPFAHRALPYDHLFGRVLTNKHTPPSLHYMAAGDVAPTVG